MDKDRPIPAVAIVGYSGAGKTTLIEAIIPLLKARGWSVGTLKHDAHQFDIDQPGKDTYRHRTAGAQAVMITSSVRWAFMVEQAPNVDLNGMIKMFEGIGVNGVIVEGYKQSPLPKIVVLRRSADLSILEHVTNVRCCAVGGEFDDAFIQGIRQGKIGVPTVNLCNIEALADQVEKIWRAT